MKSGEEGRRERRNMKKTDTSTVKKRLSLPPALLFLLPALPLCACAAVFFHRAVWFGAALLLLAGADLVSGILRRESVPRLLPCCGSIAAGVCALFLRAYFPVLLLFSLAFVFSAVRLLLAVGQTQKRRRCRLAAAGLFVFVFALPLLLGWDPDPLFRFVMQKGVMEHVPAPADTVREDGVRAIVDLEYPSAYPNNTMSVFLAPENRGTVFYVHGGGFVLGDKNTALNSYFGSWLRAGYNVAAFDYALAPQFRVEKQLVQCGEALRFFMERAADWGVDKNRVVLVGESAGGCLSGLLAAAGVSPETAKDLGVPTAEEYGAPVRGWISIGGLVDVPHFGDTNDDLVSWAFNLMGVCGFHDPAYASSETARRFSVLSQATAAFPPSYISDGNRGTFTNQGEALTQKLRSLGVRVETNFVPPEAGERPHVYEMSPHADPLAADNFEKTLAFVQEIMP